MDLTIFDMHDPPHPGGDIKMFWLDPEGISVTKGAKMLGVNRVTLSKLINERSAISPDMAVRLSKVLPPSARSWMLMQMAYDLWHAEQRRDKIVVGSERKRECEAA